MRHNKPTAPVVLPRASLPCVAYFAVKTILIFTPLLANISCGESVPLDVYGYDEGQTIVVQEPIAYTTDAYAFSGDTPISDLVALAKETSDFVWHGFAQDSLFPVANDCEPDRPGDQLPVSLATLPKTIEGVVTLHPRYFQKHRICGQSERFYGSFFIEDNTGGILILNDSRISKFTYGDHVRLRVKGLYANKFGTGFQSVIAYDSEEILTGSSKADRLPIHYEPIDRALTQADQGRTVRFTGIVTRTANNNNFNEMHLKSATDESITWIVSLDRELGLRPLAFGEGDTVQLTGPILDSFGLRMIVASLGQIEVKARAADANDSK